MTPQEKKAKSYKHDRRNAYGESDKGSRKSIPRNKAISRRQLRRIGKQLVQLEEANDINENVEAKLKSVGRKAWKKYPDVSLGEFLEHQKVKREKLANRKKEKY